MNPGHVGEGRGQRPVTVADVAAVRALMDSDSARILLSADLQTEELAARFIRALNTQQWSMPRLVEAPAEGLCFTTDIDLRNLSARLIAVFRNPGEAADDLRCYLRDLMLCFPYHRIFALVPWSLPDLGEVHREAGFQAEGVMRDHFLRGDRIEDAHVYGLLRPDFFASEPAGTHEPGIAGTLRAGPE